MDNVNQIDDYDDDNGSQPPQLPEKPRESVTSQHDAMTSRDSVSSREKSRSTSQYVISLDDEDEDYAELPDRPAEVYPVDKTPTSVSDSRATSRPIPESASIPESATIPESPAISESEALRADSEVIIPSVDITSPEVFSQTDDPIAVNLQDSNTPEHTEEEDQTDGNQPDIPETKHTSQSFDDGGAPDLDNFDLISEQEFEKLEREALVSTSSDHPSRMSSTNELLANESMDFPFEEILDQLAEFSDPKLLDNLTTDQSAEIVTPVSEPESQPSHSSYEFVHQETTSDEPIEDITEQEIQDAQQDTPPAERKNRPTSTASSSSSNSSSSSEQVPSSTEDKAVTDSAEEGHGNVARLSSLDKLETWDSGMEESLLRTSQFLMEATADHEQRMYPDELLLNMGM